MRLAAGLVAGTLVTAVAGSIVQTQINLVSITRLGAEVPVGLRLATTAEDIVRFGPVMGLITLAAFLPAFAAAWLVGMARPRWAVPAAAMAGVAGLWTAFTVMGFFTPMPTLVAAVRTAPGLWAMCATGLLGGLVFAGLAGLGRSGRA